MDESTGRFNLHQTLETTGARDTEYFIISGKHFLAVTSYYDGSNFGLESSIFQWNGEMFVVFQKIPTKGAVRFTFFEISGNNYLAVANRYDGSTFSTKSVIYRWNGSHFNKFQEIATAGALGCVVFVINNNIFIAFASYYAEFSKYSVQSTVFKWSEGHFVKLQSLRTYGAYDVKSFQISGKTFLAFANYYNGSKNNIDSFIYKWNGNKFILFQSITTRGSRALYPFVISCKTFLGVANYLGDGQKYTTESIVYQASGSQFVIYEAIPTHGASDMTSFEYKGDTYLAVANHYDQKYNINSTLYKWV